MNRDVTYCKGSNCALKEHCVRYSDGLKVNEEKDGNYWWMEDCGYERTGYVEEW